MKKIINSIIVFVLFICLAGCKCTLDKRIFGVWWWDDTLDNNYLKFAEEKGINEIYYCSDKFNDDTSKFIKEANKLGIKVYYLAGEYQWLKDDYYIKVNPYIEKSKTK